MDTLLKLKQSPTSLIIRVKLIDTTDDQGITGLTFNSAGLIISTIKKGEATATAYTQAAGNIENITTLGTYAAPTGGKCRFKEVDSTNHPGVYEIQFADARLDSTAQLAFSVHGATNLSEYDATIDMEISDVNLRQIDGAATNGNNATLYLKELNIVNNSGNAFVAQSTGAGGAGMVVQGNGSGAGFHAISGAGAYAPAIYAQALASPGYGIATVGFGSGNGIYVGAGATGHALFLQGGSTSGNGLHITTTSGHGIYSAGSVSGNGIHSVGGTTGHGIRVIGGATSGRGLYISAVDEGLYATSSSNNAAEFRSTGGGHGIFTIGNSAGHGLFAQGGSTGDGLRAAGGAAGGTGGYFIATVAGYAGIEAVGQEDAGIRARSVTSGHGIWASGTGGDTGIWAQGSSTGHGLYASGGASGGDGIYAVANGGNGNGMTLVKDGSGKDIDADEIGDVIKINGSSTAAVKLGISCDTMIFGTTDDTAVPATTLVFESSDLADAQADKYNGKVVIFYSSNNIRAAGIIDDYYQNGGRGHFILKSFKPLPAAPANGSSFIVM